MHKNVLESGKYPEATFVPSHFEGRLAVPGTSKVKLFGTFTIHGAAHEITLEAQVTTTPDKMQAAISFDIPYVGWGMNEGSE
jgi:polyisoprenoid-binding protein YceI